MNYFKADNKLIQYNPDTKIYKIRNIIDGSGVISAEEFKSLNSQKITKQNFCHEMNVYFKNVDHEWEFQGNEYRKLDNFESNNMLFSANYKIGKDIPYHEIGLFKNTVILVYHWGKVYYHTISYNGYKQGQLICPYTNKILQWARLKHCAPVYNITRKKIM